MPKRFAFGNVPSWIKARLQEWIKESTSVNVFIAGKTGTGKTTMVNGLVGNEVSPEGKTLDPGTTEVREYMCKFDDICVNVWDSPGLQDGHGQEGEYLKSIIKHWKKIDLFVYCIQMSEKRFVEGSANRDIVSMQLLSKNLGSSIWKNALIVLTFANDVVAIGKSNSLLGKELDKYFQRRLDDWKERLRAALTKEVNIPEDVADGVEIVPAGHYKHLQLLPSGECWMSRVWLKALAACTSQAQPAFIRINEHRLKQMEEAANLTGQQSVEQDFLHRRPLILAAKGEEIARALGCPEGLNLGYTIGLQSGEDSNREFKEEQLLLLLLALKNKIIDMVQTRTTPFADREPHKPTATRHTPVVKTSTGISRCATCGKHSEKLQKCGGCKRVAYCNRTCQKMDWKEHKKVCSAASMDQLQLKACSGCEKEFRTVQSCRCHKVAYCSRECQTMDWYRHKEACTAIKK